ncbi:branched-chain amino acid ABC transporter permease [Candidatus Poribacteria bacterium]|nr:branched-chain amino acid ABC transporter permease [Candidatus Poribacteria bacterium]
MKLSYFLQYLASGITVGSVYALVALGFNMIYNATGIINFAQGEFVMLGGMTMVFLTGALKLPMWISFIISVLSVTAVGALLERGAIYPLKGAPPITLIIITIGASILIRGAAILIWGEDAYRLPGITGDKPIRILGASILPQSFWVIGVGAILMGALHLFQRYTLFGKAMRASAADSEAATLVGISPRKMTLWSFAISAAIGAVAGIIITPIVFTHYNVGVMLGLKGFCAAILGGLGSFLGAVVGGFLLGVLEKLAVGFAPIGYAGYENAIAFIVMLLILFLRPSGILGRGEVEKA